MEREYTQFGMQSVYEDDHTHTHEKIQWGSEEETEKEERNECRYQQSNKE